jgi:hypothetical protein
MCYILFLLHTHYMFRPVRAIFMWILYTSYFISYYFSTADPLFVLLVSVVYMFWRFFAVVILYAADMIAYLQYLNICHFTLKLGALGSLVVKALCYKPEDRGFDTR